MFWLVLRRTGFNTPYSRVSYLVMMGEYKQFLEPGTFPFNNNLPPHLRLDKISYLDLPTTELAVSPVIDVALSERDSIKNLENVLPTSERSDLHVQFGPLKTQTIIMTPHANERYVRRRMGISEKDREAALAEERERQAKSQLGYKEA
ncbi:hypothetical protein AGDE_04782 [Angomonas deanei]|nr:hypothetical protein AGDE_04782 [Angomonas deanei]|eukprot:EPY39147.1 hypothetical protein AGDE_04782 [Angomonas deanei]